MSPSRLPPSPSFLPRLENHRRRTDPVGKEAVGRHDPHRVLPERLRPHRPAALHGQPETEVRAHASEQQQQQRHHRRRDDVQLHPAERHG